MASTLVVCGSTFGAQKPAAATPPATPPPAAPAAPKSAAMEAMAASVAAQKEAVKKQVGGAYEADPFFTLPWLSPAPEAPPVEPACDPLPYSLLEPLVKKAAEKNGLRPELVKAVIGRESGFRPCAISESGAMGLMQLMPDTADQLKVQDPFDPAESISGGARYLAGLLQRFGGELRLALAAYNAGPESIPASRELPNIPETLEYVKAILAEPGVSAPIPGQVAIENR